MRKYPKRCTQKAFRKGNSYRVTSRNPDDFNGNPEIWVFGCSYTWGWCVDDEETFPWLIQQELSDYEVTNYGVPSYGSVHGLVQLRRALEKGSQKPDFAVFTYSDVHLERNVGTPSRLRALKRVTPYMDSRMRHLRARIDTRGSLVLSLVSFDVPESEEDPSLEEQIRVTKAIFEEIFSICQDGDIAPILAVIETRFSGEQNIEGELADEVVAYCRSLGYDIVDMRVNFHGFWKNREYNCQPHDGHPNGEAHKLYAERLIARLKKLMRS